MYIDVTTLIHLGACCILVAMVVSIIRTWVRVHLTKHLVRENRVTAAWPSQLHSPVKGLSSGLCCCLAVNSSRQLIHFNNAQLKVGNDGEWFVVKAIGS
jgi:hypothetical protein